MNPGDPIGPFGRLIETETAYRTNPAVSNSSINTFLWNEWWYQQVHVLKRIQQEDTTALTFGRAFHCMILEPPEYEKRFAAYDGVRRGKAYDEFKAKETRTVLTEDEEQTLYSMREAVSANPAACGLIDACETEVVFRHMCNGNLARQCRVDGITPFGSIIDLKSAQTIEEFRANFKRYGYHRQAAWYRRLVAAVTGDGELDFTFVVVEKKAPYRCEMFRLDEESATAADREIDDAVERLERCLESNQWRRNQTDIQYLSLYRRQDVA